MSTALSPTNNAAEQALHSIVLKRKISGPTRSLRGDHFVGRSFSVHETCLRPVGDLWKFMHEAVFASIASTMPHELDSSAAGRRVYRLTDVRAHVERIHHCRFDVCVRQRGRSP